MRTESFVVAVGTLKQVPPFSSLLTWNEEIKVIWEKPAERAPIPHAELLTLKELAEKGGTTAAAAGLRLEAKGIRGFTADTVVAKIADITGRSAKELYDIILTAAAPAGETGHKPGAGGGPGWKTLAQFCADENLPVDEAKVRLKAKGFKFDDKQTLRELAQSNGFQKPYELLEVIRGQPIRYPSCFRAARRGGL
jgi:hypothetical protein